MMLMIFKATSLGCLMKIMFLVPQDLMCKFVMMIACLLFIMIAIFMWFGSVSTLDNNYPTILVGVESYYNDKSGFVEVVTLFSNDSTILEGVESHYNDKT